MTDIIKEFYNQNPFPGFYSMNGILYHCPTIKNPYLKLIDGHIQQSKTVIDIGCGTGYISNLFGFKYPHIRFTGLDFSDALDYAKQFATSNSIKNINYIKEDFLRFQSRQQFDVVIAQGVLHHIPDFDTAFDKAKRLVKPQGKLILGLYHPWGKILKKYKKLDYRSKTLEVDQELHPYEKSYNIEMLNTDQFRLLDAFPKYPRLYTLLNVIKHSLNGGLVTYVFEKIEK